MKFHESTNVSCGNGVDASADGQKNDSIVEPYNQNSASTDKNCKEVRDRHETFRNPDILSQDNATFTDGKMHAADNILLAEKNGTAEISTKVAILDKVNTFFAALNNSIVNK